MRFELGAEGYIAVVQGMIKEDTLQAGGRACAKGEDVMLREYQKLRRCVQGDAFTGVVETVTAGWGPARQAVN